MSNFESNVSKFTNSKKLRDAEDEASLDDFDQSDPREGFQECAHGWPCYNEGTVEVREVFRIGPFEVFTRIHMYCEEHAAEGYEKYSDESEFSERTYF